MSVEGVVREVGRALSDLPLAVLEQANQALSEAHESLLHAVQGASDPEIQQAVGVLSEAATTLGAVYEQVSQAKRALERYLAKVGPVESPRADRRLEPAEATKRSAAPRALEPERIAQLREELPPPVPSPNPESKKTYGQWVDTSGAARKVVSGEDEWSAAAWERFKQAGLPARRKLAITTHVEVKVATEMIQTGQRKAELIINNRPCVGPLGCDSLLPVLLPKGYFITVYGPNGYKQTFQGGEQW